MILRSKTLFNYGDRDGKVAKIKLEVTKIGCNLKTGLYDVEVEDQIQQAVENPQPGKPLYYYSFLSKRTKSYPKAMINQLFDMHGETIVKGEDDFTGKFEAVLPLALLTITQQKPIYGTNAEDWELVDETLEVAPEITA
jgi:hypothetical protein